MATLFPMQIILGPKKLIITRRIASLRIHVEKAMERIKHFHTFDRSLPVHMTDVADRLFFFVVHLLIFIHHCVLSHWMC